MTDESTNQYPSPRSYYISLPMMRVPSMPMIVLPIRGRREAANGSSPNQRVMVLWFRSFYVQQSADFHILIRINNEYTPRRLFSMVVVKEMTDGGTPIKWFNKLKKLFEYSTKHFPMILPSLPSTTQVVMHVKLPMHLSPNE